MLAGCVLATAGLRQQRAACLGLVRGMARGRGFYIKDGSNKQDITPEVKELLQSSKDSMDKSWRLGPGIKPARKLDLTTEERTRAMQYLYPKYLGTRVNDGEDAVTYYPHEGEEVPTEPASPVLMVKRISPLKGEPWWTQNYCDQIGLGKKEPLGKRAFLPNLPSVCLHLYRIKHIIKITPVTFPDGMPEDFDPSKGGYYLDTHTGVFRIHPDIKTFEPEEVARRAEWLKVTKIQMHLEGKRHWRSPFNSVLGNSNYYQDSRWTHNELAEPEAVKNRKKKY